MPQRRLLAFTLASLLAMFGFPGIGPSTAVQAQDCEEADCAPEEQPSDEQPQLAEQIVVDLNDSGAREEEAPDESGAANDEPVEAAAEPESADEPVAAPDEPESADEPFAAPAESGAANDEPVAATDEPVAATDESGAANDEPVETGTASDEPLVSGDGPVLLEGGAMLPAANAVELGNVKLPDSAQVANTPLVLNGAGIRVKAIFKMYVAALYLADKKSTPAEVISLGGPKRMQLVLLRDMSSDQFGRDFLDGISNNSSKIERNNIINQLEKFGEMFASLPEVKKGDVITMDWTPGVGSVASLNGKKIAEPFPDEAFYNAFLRIWLGPLPAYAPLKPQLLGGAENVAAPTREQ